MYGKLFDSTFTGSMVGAGPHVFAVWAYVIANTHNAHVELNPKLLAMILGASEDDIGKAIAFLAAPDPDSRSEECEGRRIVKDGQYQYFVVNHEKYRGMCSADERREYNRQKQAESRARKASSASLTVIDKSAPSTQPESTPEPTPKENGLVGSPKAEPDARVAEIVDAWNAMATEAGIPKVVKLTPQRKSAIHARLRDAYWRDNWRHAIHAIPECPFLLGSDGWTANLDWFLRPSTVTKIMEGQYHAPARPKKKLTGLAAIL